MRQERTSKGYANLWGRGPLGVFAVVEKQDNMETMHYILKDHQGNWTVIVDADGDVEQELSYDAWGNLRNPNTWCVDASITKRRNLHSVLKIPLPPLLAERLGGKFRQYHATTQ